MGGIFTSVEDLATWVGGFQDAITPRDGPDDTHPLRRASRREMQQVHVSAGFVVGGSTPDSQPLIVSENYGYGLFIVNHAELGKIVTHSGGYPGFGSNMRWHPGSGLGVIVLANHRYAAATVLAREQLDALIRAETAPLRRPRPNAATEAARSAVEDLIERWDEGRARDLFAMNVELDEPLGSRAAFIATLRERHGALRRDESEPVVSLTGFHAMWWLAGERGRVKVEILLSPELPPKVQTFAVTSVPEPSVALRTVAERILAAMAPPESGPVTIDWPADLVVGATVDIGTIVRAMRAAEALYGRLRLGAAIAGDGETKVTYRLSSPRGRVDLALELDPVAGCLSSASIVPVRQELPKDI
jgi:hypothetical protein